MIRLLIAWLAAVRRWRRPWEHDQDKSMAALYAALYRGVGTFVATDPGECVCCGHDWIPGEIIGQVAHAYERLPGGTVRRNPGTRLACSVCVERQRYAGDLSLQWARDAGVA